MTTDNRTNEPTEVQIEAAAKVLLRDYQWQYDGGEVSEFLDVARAALMAAQEAAPQAEREELTWYKRAAKHSADSMAEARATLQMFADRVDPFVFDELSSVLDDQPLDYETGDVIGEAAPVPSSTVDAIEIAYVIKKFFDPFIESNGTQVWVQMQTDTGIVREIADAVVAYFRGKS